MLSLVELFCKIYTRQRTIYEPLRLKCGMFASPTADEIELYHDIQNKVSRFLNWIKIKYLSSGGDERGCCNHTQNIEQFFSIYSIFNTITNTDLIASTNSIPFNIVYAYCVIFGTNKEREHLKYLYPNIYAMHSETEIINTDEGIDE